MIPSYKTKMYYQHLVDGNSIFLRNVCNPIPEYNIITQMHFALEHVQAMLLPQCDRPSFTPNNRQHYSSVSLKLYILRQQMGRQKFLDRTVADISRT